MSFFALLVTALMLTVLVEFAVFLTVFMAFPSELMPAIHATALQEDGGVQIVALQLCALLLIYSLLINSFTNPLLNYFYNYVFHEILALEAAVVLVESVFLATLMEIKYPKALLISIVANLASALFGALIL
jgi:hypothetical protein